jgi:hypothetical protein
MRLWGKGGRDSNSVVTTFSLKKVENKSGIPYSQAQFSVDRNLTPEEKTTISALSEQVRKMSGGVGVNRGEVSDMDEAAMNKEEYPDDDIPVF